LSHSEFDTGTSYRQQVWRNRLFTCQTHTYTKFDHNMIVKINHQDKIQLGKMHSQFPLCFSMASFHSFRSHKENSRTVWLCGWKFKSSHTWVFVHKISALFNWTS